MELEILVLIEEEIWRWIWKMKLAMRLEIMMGKRVMVDVGIERMVVVEKMMKMGMRMGMMMVVVGW